MRSWLGLCAVGTLLFVGGIALGALITKDDTTADGPSQAPRERSAATNDRTAASDPDTTRRLARLERQLRNVDDKLNVLLSRDIDPEPLTSAGTPADAEPSAAPISEPEGPSQEQLQQLTVAHDYVTSALDRGSWTNVERERLRELTAELDGPELFQVHQPISIAINSGRLKVDIDGAPF